jgi:hypothetical protein
MFGRRRGWQRDDAEVRMRIDAQYGSDTDMYLVDVYLESDRECALSHCEIWAELRPLFAAQGIHVAAVLDCFLHRRAPQGNWVSAGVLPWGDG